MDAFLQSFSEDFVQEVGIPEENGTMVSPNNQVVTFKYKLEGMEYETILPTSPSPVSYQLPTDTRMVMNNKMMMVNNNRSSSVTAEPFYPGELTPPVSLYSSPLQEADTGLLIKQTNRFFNKQIVEVTFQAAIID